MIKLEIQKIKVTGLPETGDVFLTHDPYVVVAIDDTNLFVTNAKMKATEADWSFNVPGEVKDVFNGVTLQEGGGPVCMLHSDVSSKMLHMRFMDEDTCSTMPVLASWSIHMAAVIELGLVDGKANIHQYLYNETGHYVGRLELEITIGLTAFLKDNVLAGNSGMVLVGLRAYHRSSHPAAPVVPMLQDAEMMMSLIEVVGEGSSMFPSDRCLIWRAVVVAMRTLPRPDAALVRQVLVTENSEVLSALQDLWRLKPAPPFISRVEMQGQMIDVVRELMRTSNNERQPPPVIDGDYLIEETLPHFVQYLSELKAKKSTRVKKRLTQHKSRSQDTHKRAVDAQTRHANSATRDVLKHYVVESAMAFAWYNNLAVFCVQADEHCTQETLAGTMVPHLYILCDLVGALVAFLPEAGKTIIDSQTIHEATMVVGMFESLLDNVKAAEKSGSYAHQRKPKHGGNKSYKSSWLPKFCCGTEVYNQVAEHQRPEPRGVKLPKSRQFDRQNSFREDNDTRY